ncbi:MAG: helix-turn-helix domain-containing protein [bacterium]
MKGKHIKFLRERAKISQAEMAKILEISLRTLAKWESDLNNIIPHVYIKAYQTSFENLILSPTLRTCTEKIFEEIPSEFIGIWLLRYSVFPIQFASEDLETYHCHANFWEVILHENTCRYQCLCKSEDEKNKCYWRFLCDGKSHYNNIRLQVNLKQDSQTTYPLHSGETINLTEDEIINFPHKRFPGRGNLFYHDQLCHSLLHVPYHIPNETGPRPVALLSLENKLERDQNGTWKVKTFSKGTKGSAFTKENELIAKNLIKRIYEEELKDILEAFDYLPSSI